MKKLYQVTYIFCSSLWSLFIHLFDTNLLAPRRILGLQVTYIFCSSLWSLFIHLFDTNLLAPRRILGLQVTYIFCSSLWSLFIHLFDTNLLAPRRILGLQWICRGQLFIQTTHLHCRLLCNYVGSLLAYCRR